MPDRALAITLPALPAAAAERAAFLEALADQIVRQLGAPTALLLVAVIDEAVAEVDAQR